MRCVECKSFFIYLERILNRLLIDNLTLVQRVIDGDFCCTSHELLVIKIDGYCFHRSQPSCDVGARFLDHCCN